MRIRPKLRMFAFLTLCLLILPQAASQAETVATEGKPVVYFGIIPRYNPMVMYRNYQPLMDYLTEHTSFQFELKLSRNYTEAISLVRSGETPIASLGDVLGVARLAGITAAKKTADLIPLAHPWRCMR